MTQAKFYSVLINLIVLFIGAFLIVTGYLSEYVLPLLLLILPLLGNGFDKSLLAKLDINSPYTYLILVLLLFTLLLSILTDALEIVIRSYMYAAIPEEFYFRAFLQKSLGNNNSAIIAATLSFSLMHFITRGFLSGVMVFIPSLIFGWIFKKTENLYLVVVVHASANIIYLQTT